MTKAKMFLVAGSLLVAAAGLFAFKAEAKKHVGGKYFWKPTPTTCVTQTCTTFDTGTPCFQGEIPTLWTNNNCNFQLINPPTSLSVPTAL